MNKERLIDVNDLAEYLGISIYGIYRMTSQKASEQTIPYYKIGRRCRFKLSEIDIWLEAKAKGKATENGDLTKTSSF